MNLLLLGGVSPENKEWVYEVEAALAPLFEKTVVHEYAHWTSAISHMDFNHELRAVRGKAREMGKYVIFAKSAGVVLSLKGIHERVFDPESCLFVGTPLGFVEQHGHEMDVWLKSLRVPTLFAQKSHDPAGAYQEVERFLHQHMPSRRYKTVELPGNTHHYEAETVKELMSGLSLG